MTEPAYPDRGLLRALEPAHRETFTAFARPARDADGGLARATDRHDLVGPAENVELARRAFDGPQGTIDLVPGPGSVNCVVMLAGSEEAFAGGTSTESAARDGVGYVRSAEQRSAMFVGVLPAGARDLRATSRAGHQIPVQLNPDGAYWVTITEPVDLVWNQADGSTRQTAFGRFGMYRVILGDEPEQ